MAVKVQAGVRSSIRQEPGFIVIQVQRASDPERAAVALEKASRDIADLDAGWQSAPGLAPGDRNGPKAVSGVFPTPAGPFITIDGGHSPNQTLRQIPDIVARHLAEAGVDAAVIASPRPGGPLLDKGRFLPHLPRAVVLRLFPPPPTARFSFPLPPAHWLEEAAAWLGADVRPGEEVMAKVRSMQFGLSSDACLGFLEECYRARTSAVVVSGDLKARVRGAHVVHFISNVALAVGGDAGDEELLETVGALQDVGRRLAGDVSYAFVSIDGSLGCFDAPHHCASPEFEPRDIPVPVDPTAYAMLDKPPSPANVAKLSDEIVPEAYPWQILGPGHLRRLGHVPAGARPLPGGRVELAIGEAESWLIRRDFDRTRGRWGDPIPRRQPGIQEAAREVLRPCLMTENQVLNLLGERFP